MNLQTRDSTGHEGGLDLLWGATEIAHEISVSRRQCFYLLERELIPARKIGRAWVASRDALRRHILGEAA